MRQKSSNEATFDGIWINKNKFMETTRELKQKILLFLFISIGSLAGIFITRFYAHPDDEFDNGKKERFEKVLREKEQHMGKVLQLIIEDEYNEIPFNTLHKELQPDLWQKEGLTFFLYRNDSLIYWSNNNVPALPEYKGTLFSSPFMHYGNGWFRVMTLSPENLEAIGLILVKNDFPYQNEYLVNDFQHDFKAESHLRLDTIPGPVNIQSDDGQFLFSIAAEESTRIANKTNMLVFVLWIVFFISLVILLFYLYHLFDFFRKHPLLLLVAFIIDAILVRFILLYFEIPAFLYNSDLFSPYYFATSFISPSLGDLVINSLFWLTLAWIFYSKCSSSLVNWKLPLRITLSTMMALLSGWLFYLLINTIKRLVIDSNIELNLNNIFNIDLYSGLGFLSITALIMAFFLATSRLICMVCQSNIRTGLFILISFCVSLLTLPLFLKGWTTGYAMVFPVLLFIYFLSFLYFSKIPHGFRSITGALVYIILFSLITTFVLDIYHGVKEKETRKIIAAELSSKRDPLMEFEFTRVAGQVIADTSLANMLMEWKTVKLSDDLINNYIREKYFNNFWNKYDLFITICSEQDVLNIQPEGYLANCFGYFNERLKSNDSEAISNGLYFLNDPMGNSNYLAGLDIVLPGKMQSEPIKIFFEIYHKYISETGLGYPDLLIDQRVKMISDLGDYSYAKYFQNKLIYKNGDFNYDLGLQSLTGNLNKSYFVDYEGYNHYVLNAENDNTLIISNKNLTLLDLIAPFSYLFILFSLFLVVFLLGFIAFGGISRIEFNFSNQLQVSIISIIIISFFILGMITRANIIHLYNEKNRDNLSEKTFSVLTEMEHKLGNAPVINDDMQSYISEILYKFSVIFYSDINLFDTKGNLIASSRPQIFDEELLSRKINTGAYYKLSVEQSLLYIQNEKIGGQEYLSAYIPFRNNEDRIIAYLNLPYFAKQTELRKEIGDFLATYINVYVLLIVMAIVVTILVSRIISRPLQLIREKLSGIGLGKSNEKIEWKKKDEIGNLVEEYNRMIDELARSAELLARSERESAWREMAKQVAHEIKNPLTPMKLSVQYLQKAWDDKAPDWENQLSRFTRTIVEQIDSLSEIASEFSDFAKMPAAKIEKTGLTEVIKSVADLYRHHRHITISIDQDEEECYVMADKKQLLRVFNNLIQNAVQAIGKKSGGLIRIHISREDDFYDIGITDNGSGITDEQAAKIFSPSFTTKSSGMGLGLALVRSILTTINGTISFKSKPGEGATFTVRIPACHD
jgi:signal transduction histidine kinase